MNTFIHPKREEWPALLRRPALETQSLEKTVKKILLQVKLKGDKAVKKYTREFDKISLRKLEVSEKEFREAEKQIDDSLKNAIKVAGNNIRNFHEKQLNGVEVVETMPGVNCWRRSIGIEKVGLYIPGGTAPLFSTILMLGIPAAIAGCKEVVLCSPPGPDGKLDPAILFAANMVGIKKVFKVGGVQAIAAMTYGTESIPKVYKLFGPGNQYVTCAKQLVQQEGIAIDMPAGPSELAVFADGFANPGFVAADLLSQAEHGADSQVLLVSTDQSLLGLVQTAIESQLKSLPRKEIAAKALANSKLILVKDRDTAIDLLNDYAAEHLILNCTDANKLANHIVNAGSIFIGSYSPESVGDYASGTNHTLPTNGYAKAYSGVSVDSFVKKITYQQLTKEGLDRISDTVIQMAEAEGLKAHAEAVRKRLEE